MKKNITVRDIAREANVSPATVSRVLTGNAKVKEDTYKKVQEVIQKYNFKPNALARSLFKKESKTIGVILPDITNEYYALLFSEIERASLDRGYNVFLCNSLNDRDNESHYLEILQEKQVDGMIFLGGRINDLFPDKKRVDEIKQAVNNLPFVMINGFMDDVECFTIASNEEKAIIKAVGYLHGLGHEKIGIMLGIPQVTTSYFKKKAFEYAILKYGLKQYDQWIVHADFNYEVAMVKMQELIDQGDLPTALIAINDYAAAGIIRACYVNGISVPDDLSVIGYDNVTFTKFSNPNITTLSHPYKEIGKLAVKTIDEAVKSQKRVKPQNIKLLMELVERESCKAIK